MSSGHVCMPGRWRWCSPVMNSNSLLNDYEFIYDYDYYDYDYDYNYDQIKDL